MHMGLVLGYVANVTRKACFGGLVACYVGSGEYYNTLSFVYCFK